MGASRPSDNPTRGGTPALVEVHAEGASGLSLSYDDGTAGILDLSNELLGGGVFAPLQDPAVFAGVRLGEFGQVEWPVGVELCPDALYLRLTEKSPEDLFPGLSRQRADA
jgi:hypothetical protein